AKGKGKVVLRPSQIQVGGVDDSPLWNHVKVTGGAAGGGGNRHSMCNYCNKKVTGGDKFDIDGHLLTELAELSLDEPDLEAVTFDDNVEKQPVEVDELGAQNLDGDEME
ncbi:hypothetical protein RJ640_006130, partial [Escallonia rubra]